MLDNCLSEVKIKKIACKFFYVYFMEILYFHLDYLFIYLFSCQYNMIFVLFTTRIFIIIRIWWVLYLIFFLLILPTVVVILFNIPTKTSRLSTYFRPLYSPFQFSVQAIDIYTTYKVSVFLHVYVYVCKVCLFSLFICVKFDSFMAFQWVIFSFWLGLLRCFKLEWVL